MSETRHFALCVGHERGTWFLSRAANAGNLMRTSDPFSARTWPTVAEVRAWLDSIPEANTKQIRGRELTVVPLTIGVGPAAETLPTIPVGIEPASAIPVETKPKDNDDFFGLTSTERKRR